MSIIEANYTWPSRVPFFPKFISLSLLHSWEWWLKRSLVFGHACHTSLLRIQTFSLLGSFTFFSFGPQISFDRPNLLDLTVPHARVLLFSSSSYKAKEVYLHQESPISKRAQCILGSSHIKSGHQA